MNDEKPIELNSEQLRQKINLETSQLSWSELQRHFARGVVIVVSDELDLIEVAAVFSEDNKSQVEKWLNSKLIHRAQDDDARLWQAEDCAFWSAVVAPWVLVQETKTS